MLSVNVCVHVSVCIRVCVCICVFMPAEDRGQLQVTSSMAFYTIFAIEPLTDRALTSSAKIVSQGSPISAFGTLGLFLMSHPS